MRTFIPLITAPLLLAFIILLLGEGSPEAGMGIFFVVLVPSVIYLPIFYLIVQWYHRRQHRLQLTKTGHTVDPSRTPLRILLIIANSFPLAFLLFMKLNDCLVPYLPCLTFNQNNLGILVFMALASGHALIYWLMQRLLGSPPSPASPQV